MLFDPEACERLHNRNVSVTTYAYESDAIALEGRLTDDRFVATYSIFDEHRPAGIVHDMVIRMIVRGPTKERHLTIQSLKNIIDTCHLWRSDGPMVQNLKKRLGDDQ